MSRFLSYNPDQVLLVPPDVKQVLGSDHLCFFVHEVVERLDLKGFVEAYSVEGGMLYHPSLMLKVWLYAYLLGLTSSRRLEQRVREDLAFRYLAGGAQPDFWALNEFRRRHTRGINDAFVQVLEIAQEVGLARIGTVAVDSTRVKANASPDRIELVDEQREERARRRRRVRQWQKACAEDDPNEGAGVSVGNGCEKVQQMAVPRQLAPLPKLQKRSRTDSDSRFLRERGRFVLGYTGEIAVTEDHFIAAARVTQSANDNQALAAIVEEVKRNCSDRPRVVLADSGFYSTENIAQLSAEGVDVYVPDSNLARELNGGPPATGIGRMQPSDPYLLAMRHKLRTRNGKRRYRQRKTIVEPVFGVLKAQRGMRSFRLRGLAKVNIEWILAATAYNLGRLYRSR